MGGGAVGAGRERHAAEDDGAALVLLVENLAEGVGDDGARSPFLHLHSLHGEAGRPGAGFSEWSRLVDHDGGGGSEGWGAFGAEDFAVDGEGLAVAVGTAD